MGKFLRLINGLPTMIEESSTTASYDESIYYSTGLSANTDITLPNSGQFLDPDAKDILIFLNDRAIEVARDFVVIGAGPNYTVIQINYDLADDSVIRFKKNI